MENNNWSNKKIGAFWIKKTKADKQYLSGNIEIKLKDGTTQKVILSIYKNDFKKDNNPDFNVYQIDVL
jgi:uncharacterized protein (DUF736 family)